MLRRPSLILVALLLSARSALAEEPAAPTAGGDARSQKLAETLSSGVRAALDRDGKRAHRELTQLSLMAPDLTGIEDLPGLAALVAGDAARARQLLGDRHENALYRAIAEADGPGGLARSRELLAAGAKLGDDAADPGVLFLAALAFAGAGEDARAQELLERAVKLAPSALDEAFAPDPAVALARQAIAVLEKLGPSTGAAQLAILEKLLEKGRRHGAAVIAEKLASASSADAATKEGARRLMISALERGEPRRALEEVEILLRDAKDREEPTLLKAELLARLGDVEPARKTLAALGAVKTELRARQQRVKAKLALEKGGDPREALEAAETAASLEPKSNVAQALLCRALLANGHVDRASAFAQELLKRKPKDVDPFAILEAISEAKKETGKVRMLQLRSQAFREERQKADREAARREKVLRAVREAEAGLGIAGLTAIRGEEPMLALPAELATAKSGTPGFKRAARDRILAACKGELAILLRRTGGWDGLRLPFSPYGAVDSLEVPLTAADPGRCTDAMQRTRAPGTR